MSTRFSEFQRLRAAHAVSRDRFCIAIHELDVDDQFSIILEYDGTFPQPWSRVEVRRNVVGITARPVVELGDRPYIAISDEGDVFFIGDDGILTEKIPGAGVYSADSDGSGAINGISFLGEELYAFGLGGQLYLSVERDNWRRLNINDLLAAERGNFTALTRIENHNLYIAGSVAPQQWKTPEDIRAARREAAAAGDFERFQELSKEAERWADRQGFARKPVGLLLYGHADGLAKLDIGTEQNLTDIFVEASGRIWIVGTGGLILLGNSRDGFRDVSFHGDRNGNLLSVTKFRDQITIASDYGLHAFDGHVLSSIKPRLNPFINRNIPTPLKIQAVDDVLFYFDYKHGVHRWDGQNWEEIEIPAELLEREFNRLP